MPNHYSGSSQSQGSMVVAMAANGIPNSLSASIPPDYMENGRLYHGYRKGTYMYPCDEEEKERLDIYHEFFRVARHQKLFETTLTNNYDGPRILDLGCGTGIWAIDMADKYPQAEVQGFDISLIQPNTIPPNLSFRRRDYEAPWHGVATDSWDLIHLRMLFGSVTNWAEMYQKIFRHLKPNFGWMEHVELDFYPRCDDGSVPPDAAVFQWGRYLVDAADRAYKPISCAQQNRQLIEMTGFVDITERTIRVPLNPWPTDPHQRDIGRWYCLGLVQGRGLEAMTMAPLTRMCGWSKEQVDALVADVKREICKRQHHLYCNMHIWTARRPAV